MSTGRLIRRCVFAAPLVITVAAAAPACTRTAPPTPPHVNPPGPDVPPEPPAGKPGAWAQVGDAWQYKYEDGDTVWLGEDGECRLVSADHCGSSDGDGKPVITTCNPPPPQDVACPPGRPGT